MNLKIWEVIKRRTWTTLPMSDDIIKMIYNKVGDKGSMQDEVEDDEVHDSEATNLNESSVPESQDLVVDDRHKQSDMEPEEPTGFREPEIEDV
jgi:hypothetical protein